MASSLGYLQMFNLKTLLVLALSTTCISSTTFDPVSNTPTEKSIVDLTYARYLGSTVPTSHTAGENVTFFGGIPYAQPPLGSRRFAAPQPLHGRVQKDGVPPLVDAREWAEPCVQQPAKLGVGVEDCLKLNVWKPTKAKEGDNLPVVVYIHGGGFYAGGPRGFPLHTWVTQSLSQNGRGLIGITIAYRLNLLGFLGSHSILQGTQGGALNRGLLDQRMALKWVKDNIHKFGGNGKDVTIVGESAGGASVVMQLVAYGGKRPTNFQRVIAHSIGYQQMPNMTMVQQRFEVAASAMSCAVGGFSSDTEIMKCLESAPLDSLIAGINSIPNNHLAPHLEPDSMLNDGLKTESFLPALPSTLLRTGRFARNVQFIGGHATHDGRNFAGGRPEHFQNESDVRRLVFGGRWPWVTNATINKGLALYPPSGPGSPFADEWERAWTVGGNVVFTCMDLFAAQQVTKYNKKNSVDPAYLFRWNSPNPVLYQAEPWRGVMHTSDLFFLFNGSSAPDAGATFTALNQTEQYLADEATAYWTSLVSSGDPNRAKTGSSSSPVWRTAFGTREGVVGRRLILTQAHADGEGGTPRTLSRMEDVDRVEDERCAFWMSEDVTRESAV
ncbi:Alpha/Beta hydrolase protein [Pterulicium gracile]|uniref:Carboxylic ester hydrolase n=1 Tax=Pterulicium gracile TaxID=1884261 RepID=A0A5C3QHL3_9AGAR|nr:Alpha/Beta hydrolase protein [Pterula gracilis]